MTVESKSAANPAQSNKVSTSIPLKAKLAQLPEEGLVVSSPEKLQSLIKIGQERSAAQNGKHPVLDISGVKIFLEEKDERAVKFILFEKYASEETSIEQQRKTIDLQLKDLERRKFDDLVRLFEERKQAV